MASGGGETVWVGAGRDEMQACDLHMDGFAWGRVPAVFQTKRET
jgi:hypothetical protein